MSYTVSRGLVDASHWTGMASSVAGYLEKWLTADEEQSPLPNGQFAAAERFFAYVLQGTALDRHERLNPDTPTMAGISNLTIAVKVLAALPWNGHTTHEQVEMTVQSYRECLAAIRAGDLKDSIDTPTVDKLKGFLRELQRQGNLARHAAFAAGEFSLV